MLTALSSRRTRRSFSSVRIRLIVASCVLATMLSAAANAGDPIQVARFSEENLPAQDMPSVVATPQAASSPAADWMVVPASSPKGPSPAATAPGALPQPSGPENSPLPVQTNAAQIEPTPVPSPTDVAPLEVGSVAPQIEISDASLDTVIQRVRITQPALAASLRVTDQARDEIIKRREGDAIQTLARAISIDGSNPYAYFYLGRAYLAKKNYDQAITFMNRAELRFAANPEWLGETLAFEGLANEQAGQTAPAITCYQKALVAVPGNLMARVGFTRLSGEQAASPAPVPSPAASDAPTDASSEGSAIAPPPDSPPSPAAN